MQYSCSPKKNAVGPDNIPAPEHNILILKTNNISAIIRLVAGVITMQGGTGGA